MRVGTCCFAIAASAIAAFIALTAARCQAGTVYFLVAEPNATAAHGDSFVLPLTNPNHIRETRRQIAHVDEESSAIVIAQIAAGADGINRDLLAPGRPAWSWHVTQFEGFAFAAAEILDGWPGFVEQDVDSWLRNTDSRIGFWTYRVVAELDDTGEPVPVPAAALPGAALFVVVAAGALRRKRPSCALAYR